jgi:hypothetical protein
VLHTSVYLGAISRINNGKWQFTGTITSYVMTLSTQGTLAGTGSLSRWSPALNNHRGGWQLAKSGVDWLTRLARSRLRPPAVGHSRGRAATDPSTLAPLVRCAARTVADCAARRRVALPVGLAQ